MHKLMLTVAGAGMLLTTAPVMAETMSGWGAGARLSSLGYGVEVTKSLTRQLNARVGVNTFSHSDTRTEGDITYDADLSLRNANLLLDWHPFENGFRMSLGYLLSNNELDLESQSTGTVTVGNSEYELDGGYVNGTAEMGGGAYVGLGYSRAGRSGWSFTADLGVVMQGSPDVSLTSNVVGDEDLRAEERELESDLDEFDRYPVVGIGISYGF
ncbi:hypothetical protein [Thiohalomonas denitrificans]|uniref:Outer membrane protein beta-barrel domain-containing protein n=1 Tax=Thiohalomonas denitrificans TaxID=415747 RepID=A0A1G5Q259_9GAMM|nr:hypothetical protein [Thiohalomonas denitrificans]SCZ55742.1 hypothetical protein SAMN03097708_01189 [Thiohalomonas denitrificans]